jgi:hypothetical protein
MLVASLRLLPVLLFPWSAAANPIRFLGSHPISGQSGGGYCYVEVAHTHDYRPKPRFLFQEVDHQYVFTADPVPFGYDGRRYVFFGHHPISTDAGGAIVYCFLDDFHYHAFAPQNDPSFIVRDGVAFYVGLFSPYFFQLEAEVRRPLNELYRTYAALRPTSGVSPPPEWRLDMRLPPSRPSVMPARERTTLHQFHRDVNNH